MYIYINTIALYAVSTHVQLQVKKNIYVEPIVILYYNLRLRACDLYSHLLRVSEIQPIS